jgi:hypothetical protein
MGFTSPTPAPIVEENAQRTWTIGFNHIVDLMSPDVDSLDSSNCLRSRVRIAVGLGEMQVGSSQVGLVGDLQVGEWRVSNSTINECLRRSTFVFFLYSSRESLKEVYKLESEEEEIEAVDVVSGIAAATRRGQCVSV